MKTCSQYQFTTFQKMFSLILYELLYSIHLLTAMMIITSLLLPQRQQLLSEAKPMATADQCRGEQ